MSSANNHCKQFRPRSGPTKVGPDLDLKCLYSDGIHERLKKNDFEEKSVEDKKSCKNFQACIEFI